MSGIQRVLVPTDFTVDSLRIALEYLENNGDNQRVELVLVCGYDLGDSITVLLGFTKDDHLARLQGEDFVKGCEMIKSRFKQTVVEMYADLLISKNARYVRNYLKGNRITQVVLPETYGFRFFNRHCFDILNVLKAVGLEALPEVVSLPVVGNETDNIDTMDSIFFRKGWKVSYE
jgi:hypothetical protein